MEKGIKKKLNAIGKELLKKYPGYFDNDKQRTNIVKGHNAKKRYKPKEEGGKEINEYKDYSAERFYNPEKNLKKNIIKIYEALTEKERRLEIQELISLIILKLAPHYGLIQQK